MKDIQNKVLLTIVTLLWVAFVLLVLHNVDRIVSKKEEHVTYTTIYGQVQIECRVTIINGTASVFTEMRQLKPTHTILLMYNKDSCPTHQLDSLKHEHAKKIGEKLDEVLSKSL